MIGFAGRRVIEQNIGEKLPDDFQTAEFQLAKGFVDDVVERPTMREYIGKILKMHSKKKTKLKPKASVVEFMSVKPGENKNTPWQKVRIARAHERPTTLDYVVKMFDDFVEFHGDRSYEDDHAIVGGIASLNGFPVTVVGQQKGKKDLSDAVYRNWGMASQSGYRKALRLMKQAEKFKRPVLCFVDTAGAYCGIDAEEHGQGRAIADNLAEMSDLKTPILSIVIGEGGSGGALALSHADRIWMLEDAYFSVVSPESCANILWKDPGRAGEVAGALNLTADKLFKLGLIDKICRKNKMKELSEDLKKEFEYLGTLKPEELLEERYRKFRRAGYRSY